MAASAASSAVGSGVVERLVGEPQSGRGIRAAAAEAGCDGDPLRDRRAPARLDAGGGAERDQRVAHERVAGEAGHLEARSGRDRDPVAEVDSLQDGHDLVLAVVAQWPDDEREIDLGRRGCSVHRA